MNCIICGDNLGDGVIGEVECVRCGVEFCWDGDGVCGWRMLLDSDPVFGWTAVPEGCLPVLGEVEAC